MNWIWANGFRLYRIFLKDSPEQWSPLNRSIKSIPNRRPMKIKDSALDKRVLRRLHGAKCLTLPSYFPINLSRFVRAKSMEESMLSAIW